MIEHAWDAGVSTSWVTGDEVHSRAPGLEAREVGYVLAVSCATRVRINQGRTAVRADRAALRLPVSAWHRQSVGSGPKGPGSYDWAGARIGADEHRHVPIRRNPPPSGAAPTGHEDATARHKAVMKAGTKVAAA